MIIDDNGTKHYVNVPYNIQDGGRSYSADEELHNYKRYCHPTQKVNATRNGNVCKLGMIIFSHFIQEKKRLLSLYI
jgi:hypothetical protein